MQMRLVLCMVFCLLAAEGVKGSEGRTWEFREGGWIEIATPAPTAPVLPDPQLDQAEQLLGQHDYQTAKKILVE